MLYKTVIYNDDSYSGLYSENGNIIEHWSHKELLAKDNGIYKKLRDIQSGWFIE
jgi:ABC-type transport system involved in Fe-S cluster assembly fused permease/ATPase subunit